MSSNTIDPYELVAKAFRDTFENERDIRVPLKAIVETLSYSEKAKEFRKKQFQGKEPIYDLGSVVNSALIMAFNAAKICEVLFDDYRRTFQNYQLSMVPLIRSRQILESGVVLNLYNCRSLLCGSNTTEQLGVQLQTSVSEAFMLEFPRLTAARNALAHDHDRALGRFREQVIASSGQSTRSFSSGIADLIDQNGEIFEFDFSSQRILRLVEQLARLVS